MSTVTAADVRAYFNARPERLALLSPEAAHTVRVGAKGRLHAEVIEVNNKRRPTRQYVLGSTNAAKAAQRDEAKALRAAAAAAGHVGTRGPLPKAVLASLSKQ